MIKSPASYSWDPGFKSLLGYRLFWPRFSWFSSVLPSKCRDSTLNYATTTSKSFLIRHSLITLLFDAMLYLFLKEASQINYRYVSRVSEFNLTASHSELTWMKLKCLCWTVTQFVAALSSEDRLCGLVVSVETTNTEVPGSIPGHSLGFFWGSWVWNRFHSASWSDKLSSYLNKEVTVRFGKLKMQLWDSMCW
jgi:hypothetical protein